MPNKINKYLIDYIDEDSELPINNELEQEMEDFLDVCPEFNYRSENDGDEMIGPKLCPACICDGSNCIQKLT